MEVKYIAIFIVIILIFYRLRLARQSATFKEKQKGETSKRWTYSLLLFLYIVIILASILECYFSVKKFNVIFSSVGFVAYVTGIIGRNKAIKTLGKYWSIHIEIRNGQRIVQNGLYKHIRHPGYLSLIIESLSIPVMLNALNSFVGVILIYIPAVLIRANFEDMEMKNKIGKEFIVYKGETGAFIPKNLFDFIISSLKKKHHSKNKKRQ